MKQGHKTMMSAIAGTAPFGGFACKLWELLSTASSEQKNSLAGAFPEEVEFFEAFAAGGIDEIDKLLTEADREDADYRIIERDWRTYPDR